MIFRTVYEEPGTGRRWGLYAWEPSPVSATPSRRRGSPMRRGAATPTIPAGWYLMEEETARGGDAEMVVLDGFVLPPDTPLEVASREALAYARRRGFRAVRVPAEFSWPPQPRR